MTRPIKVIVVAGARPNFMKVAPLLHSMARHNQSRVNGTPEIIPFLVHTGQHYDEKMSSVFFAELGIPAPDVNLEVGSGSHAVQTANIMTKFEPVCEREKPDWVLVVGDVNSTMACALVASKMHIRVAHVEAGLRSFDRNMPEEINRLVTDSIADLLLSPSEDGNENLMREGVPAARIRLVGNIMIDSLLANLEKVGRSPILSRLHLEKRRFIYVTLHRPSNVDARESLVSIMKAFADISRKMPVIFPMHPRTHARLAEFGIETKDSNITILEPVGYHDSLALTQAARCVVTDSGGLQEESTFFKTPCLTLRPNTERPVTVTIGSNRLIKTGELFERLDFVLNGEETLGRVPPLWDGKTSERVIEALLNYQPAASVHRAAAMPASRPAISNEASVSQGSFGL
ncbi:MAG TPA: UDP-N-acetylglucosamine 2-epimerase (non-hydrolyzing) [Verrucomicrobiae bacterium]|jgi:UDP-N-acetylglucosamine 2-epimerase (non-hydrolysing)|nr:UDP-N-acetylglucosamine 2-epimerase (non-hydrolyzing) [Verrucomicrobiae bacterium]